MLWRRATQTSTPSPAGPVPEGESVRLAALQAAWRRDRWVARRRVWLRWTLWGAQRYGLPAVGALGVMAGLWFAVRATMGWLDAPSLPAPQVAQATQQAAPAATPPAQAPTALVAALPPYRVRNTSGMRLNFETSLPVSARRESPVSSAALPNADKMPNPQLISENWLHSKEP